jgi:hypothetical protein
MSGIVLPSYAAALVNEVYARSWCPISLVEEDAVGFDSELRLARLGRRQHEVAYVPEYAEYAVHFLVSAARKVLRLYACLPHERYVAAHEAQRGLPEEDEKELRQKFSGHLREAGIRDISRLMFAGTVRQLTSFPVDLRVERELFDELPEHRPLQRAYMKRQVKDIEPQFGSSIARGAPARIYAATTAMNVVLAEESAEIAGVPIGSLVRSSPHRALGTRLRQLLYEEKEPSYHGDRAITDAWAPALGMREWYEWVRLP